MVGRFRVFVGSLLLLLMVMPAAARAAGSPEPAWHISQASLPTNFAPGSDGPVYEGWAGSSTPEYYALISNAGGRTAEGESEPITIVDTLPAGVTFGAKEPRVRLQYEGADEHECERSAVGVVPQTVTCIVERTIRPGEAIEVAIPVAVGTDEGASLHNQIDVFGGGASPVSDSLETTISNALPQFEFLPAPQGLQGIALDEDGIESTVAGSHPYALTLQAKITNRDGDQIHPPEAPRRLVFELPRGLVANPQAMVVHCTEKQLIEKNEGAGFGCPPASQVGTLNIATNPGLGWISARLYAMEAPPGVPAEFGFNLAGVTIHVKGGVNGERLLTATTPDIVNRLPIFGIEGVVWGNPADPSHDALREGRGCPEGCGVSSDEGSPFTPDEANKAPFLTMPTSCGEQSVLGGSFESWEGSNTTASTPFSDAEGNPVEYTGCNALEFEPTISSKATTNVGDSPSGLDFNLHQPQNQQIDGLATGILRDAKVTLPEGMTLNASAANGLGSCTEQQMGYAPHDGKIRFDTEPQTCPNAAKLGSLEVKTPLLKEKLPGAIYLAKPYDNPFDNLTAIYLAVEDEEAGLVVKLAGKVTPDPVTGRLTAVFTESPELPIEDIDLHFFNGARAALTTPLTCGTKITTSVLTPWSTPEGADAIPSDSYQTQVPAGGSGNCPTSEADAPNMPSFRAGTVSPAAGAYSPFVLRLSRADGTQRLTGIDATLPKGLTGKLAGIPYCSEAQIAQAQSRSNPNEGALEQASPSCPSATEVGSIEVGAGSGPNPVYVSGKAYLAGPYKGAPLSLVAVTPAVAGPFDLGTVVVRTALYVNSETAQIHAVSDPFPSILQGVPLDLRSVTLKMDRPEFTLNPTSCDPMSLTGAATALTGQSTALGVPFQMGGCGALKFKPKLAIRLKGGTKRTRYPALRAELTFPKGTGANVKKAQVTLPHSAFLEQNHIGTVCTRVQFAAEQCPKASIYGKARAITPLLDKPVEGPVYLRSSNHELPDLVAALDGQIDVDLVGRIDTGKGGGIRNTFEAAPDAPVTKFVLSMFGGKKGLLVNSENICRKPQRAKVNFTAQNGKVSNTTPLIANDCKKAKKRKKHGKR